MSGRTFAVSAATVFVARGMSGISFFGSFVSS
jgi:hypothetical protein